MNPYTTNGWTTTRKFRTFGKDVVTLSTWRKLVAIFVDKDTVQSLIQLA